MLTPDFVKLSHNGASDAQACPDAQSATLNNNYEVGTLAAAPPRPLVAVPIVTTQPSAASVPITVLLYNGTLFCGFNVPIKGLTLPLN